MAISPLTGVVRDLGIHVSGACNGIEVSEDRLWIVSPTEVIETDSVEITWFKPKFPLSRASIPFMLNGELTVISLDVNGRHRLYTFFAGEWISGRQLAFPGLDRTWAIDAETDRSRLVPRTSQSGKPPPGSWIDTRVVQVGDAVHLVSSSFGAAKKTTAYRLGFDFINDDSETASALAPENADADASGWIQLDPRYFNWQTIPCQLRGEFMLATLGNLTFWKPDPMKPGAFG